MTPELRPCPECGEPTRLERCVLCEGAEAMAAALARKTPPEQKPENPGAVVHHIQGDFRIRKLHEELLEVIDKPDYDQITIAALVGVLEIVKHQQIHRMDE